MRWSWTWGYRGGDGGGGGGDFGDDAGADDAGKPLGDDIGGAALVTREKRRVRRGLSFCKGRVRPNGEWWRRPTR